MRFKIDENLPVEVAVSLRQEGHDAVTVFDENLKGKDDSHIAYVCQSERRALVTLDTDYADIRTYPPKLFSGVVVLRLKYQDKNFVLKVFRRIVKLFMVEPLEGQLWIVEEERIRIRN